MYVLSGKELLVTRVWSICTCSAVRGCRCTQVVTLLWKMAVYAAPTQHLLYSSFCLVCRYCLCFFLCITNHNNQCGPHPIMPVCSCEWKAVYNVQACCAAHCNDQQMHDCALHPSRCTRSLKSCQTNRCMTAHYIPVGVQGHSSHVKQTDA